MSAHSGYENERQSVNQMSIWGSPWNLVILLMSLIGAIASGLIICMFWRNWIAFALLFMTFTTHLIGGGIVWVMQLGLHLQHRDEVTEEWLTTTTEFSFVSIVLGIFERMVFTMITISLLASKASPANAHSFPSELMISANGQTLAAIIGGWIILKTLVTWRRITNPKPVVLTLSNVGLIGSALSVSLGIAAGVITLICEFEN